MFECSAAGVKEEADGTGEAVSGVGAGTQQQVGVKGGWCSLTGLMFEMVGTSVVWLGS